MARTSVLATTRTQAARCFCRASPLWSSSLHFGSKSNPIMHTNSTHGIGSFSRSTRVFWHLWLKLLFEWAICSSAAITNPYACTYLLGKGLTAPRRTHRHIHSHTLTISCTHSSGSPTWATYSSTLQRSRPIRSTVLCSQAGNQRHGPRPTESKYVLSVKTSWRRWQSRLERCQQRQTQPYLFVLPHQHICIHLCYR